MNSGTVVPPRPGGLRETFLSFFLLRGFSLGLGESRVEGLFFGLFWCLFSRHMSPLNFCLDGYIAPPSVFHDFDR